MRLELEKWKPADIARLIILLPVEHVPARKFWHKRDQRLKPSDKNAILHSKPYYKPTAKDMEFLKQAKANGQWRAFFEEQAHEFPRIGLAHGPLLADGRFYSHRDRVDRPLGAFREREAFQGFYSRVEHDYDVARLEYLKALAMENFILGQRGEGPYVDGLVYKTIDAKLDAEIAWCDARFRFTAFMLSEKRKEKRPAKESTKWNKLPPGTSEEVAMQFKHSGYQVRKIETTSARWYEVAQ